MLICSKNVHYTPLHTKCVTVVLFASAHGGQHYGNMTRGRLGASFKLILCVAVLYTGNIIELDGYIEQKIVGFCTWVPLYLTLFLSSHVNYNLISAEKYVETTTQFE